MVNGQIRALPTFLWVLFLSWDARSLLKEALVRWYMFWKRTGREPSNRPLTWPQEWKVFSGVTMHPGLSGIFLVDFCHPGIAVNSISFPSPKCPLWTVDDMTLW